MVEHMFDTTSRDPVPGDPLIAAMGADLLELRTEDLRGLPSDALSDRLVELLELRERVDAEAIRLAAAWRKRRAWEADGSLSPSAWLAYRAPIGRQSARQVVKASKVVDESPHLAAALAAGVTTAAHIDSLARVMSPQRQPVLAEHGEMLAKQAERLTIKDFSLLARRWAALADDYIASDRHSDIEPPRNEVRAGVTLNGRLDGTFSLDSISGAEFLGALDHLAPPDPVDAPDSPRSLAERRGDALADLGRRYHEGGRAGANPPSLDVVVDVATLAGTSPDLARRRCDLEGIGPIARATLAQLGCTATLRRLVMAGDSIVLDMGRKTRLATAPQARAVRIRDGGCIFPSCSRPASWCDVHHIDDWASGGATDVARMCCLCRRHHTLIHSSKWTITVSEDGSFRVTHPARAP